DRVYVAEIILGLRMNERIAVNLAGRCLKDARLYAFCEPEHIYHSHHARFYGLYRIVLVMYGRGRTRQIIYLIDLEHYRFGHVVADEFEVFVIAKMFDVLF